MTKQRKLCGLVFAFAVMLAALAPLRAGERARTLQSFGVTVQHGQPVYPHPPNVTLGLFDTDPLLDLAYCTNGNVQVWKNLGNGLLELAGERRLQPMSREWNGRKSECGASHSSTNSVGECCTSCMTTVGGKH